LVSSSYLGEILFLEPFCSLTRGWGGTCKMLQ